MPESMQYDAIVIGGGPAGSTAATFLSKREKSVLLLEKESFPRFHIGESLLPYNVPLFEEMGVLEKLENGGFMEKFGAQFQMPDGSAGAEIAFGGGKFTDQPRSWQVERSRFDEILLRHAESVGVEVRESARVHDFEINAGSGAKVTLASGETLHSTFLVDASGSSNFTGNREGIKEIYEHHQKLAIFGHFTGIPLPENRTAGDIVIYRLANSWFWLIPLSREKVSVGLVVDRERVKASGGDPAELFDRAVAASSSLRERMKTAEQCGELRTIADFSYHNRRFVSPHLIRVGDAAGFLDPIFSSGVYLAMLSGKNAAHVVANATDRGKPFTREMQRYEKETRRFMRSYFELIENFYKRPFMELLFQPDDAMLNLPDAVIAILAGQLEGGFSVRWRLKLFFLLSKIQGHYPIVRRLNWGASA